MWARAELTDVETSEVELVHVYPLFGKAHDTDHGLECWCHPSLDDDCPAVVVHNVEH